MNTIHHRPPTMFRLLNLICAAAPALILISSGCKPKTDTQQPSVLKVGVILPLTGPAAAVGEQIRQAMQLAASEIPSNRVLVFEDSENSGAKGIAAFKKLCSTDQVDAIVVAMTGVSKSVAPLAKPERRLTMAISTSVPIVDSNSEFVLRYFIDGVSEAKAMADRLVERGFKRIAVVQINDEYGKVMLNSFAKQLKTHQLAPIHVEPLKRTVSDFHSLAARLKEANPDCIYFIGYANPLGVALKQTYESGLRVPYATTFGFEIPGTRDLASEAAEGIIFTSANFGQGANMSEASRRFVQEFKRRYGQDPSNDAAFAYDLIKNLPVLASAEARKDPASLRGVTLHSQFGDVTFNDNLEAKIPIVFKTVRNGKIVAAPDAQ